MEVRPLDGLAPGARDLVFDLAQRLGGNPWFPTRGDLDFAAAGSLFEGGALWLTLWHEDRPRAQAGVVLKEVPIRGEAFVSGLQAEDALAADDLVRSAVALAASRGARRLRLGLRGAALVHEAVVEGRGFSLADRGIVMRFNGLRPSSDLRLSPLDDDTLDRYIDIHNAAFRGSPNGSTLDREELAELRRVRGPRDLGLAHEAHEVVGVYQLSETPAFAVIDALAVPPALQGRGLGRRLLHAVLDELLGRGHTAIQLLVMASNTPARALYLRHGFEDFETQSLWLERTLG